MSESENNDSSGNEPAENSRATQLRWKPKKAKSMSKQALNALRSSGKLQFVTRRK